MSNLNRLEGKVEMAKSKINRNTGATAGEVSGAAAAVVGDGRAE